MKNVICRTRALATALVVVSLLWAMSGCFSSTGSIQTSAPLPRNVVRARTIVIHVTSRVPDSEETTRELEGAVVEKLREGDAFERVFSSLSVGTRVPDLLVNATITEFDGMSSLGRELTTGYLGIFSPLVEATIVTEVVVRDGKSGATLGSATVRGESSRVTIQAIQRTAEQIAGFVSQR
jgi:hypothetical protein